MPEISRTASFGKLNPVAYKAIESATVFCKMRGNPFVELPHWLMQILGAADAPLVVGPVRHVDARVVLVGDLLHDREPQTGAPRLAGHVRLEDVVALGLGHAAAVVVDDDRHLVGVRPGLPADLDVAGGAGLLPGVHAVLD